jgi:hypothetical protein
VAPNSLIFLVIIGVWAAYLGKYWLRRRDHLATARSMDRFSESNRVLGQGRVAPSADVRRTPHRSYALTPGGPMRPQVTVKRSVPAESGPSGPPDASPAGSRRRRLVPRAARGVLLLVSLVAFVASVPTALLSDRFPLWGPVIVLANVVAAFLFLRAAVQSDLAAKRRTAPVVAPVARPAARPVRRPAPVVVDPVVVEEPALRAEAVFDDPTLDAAPAAPAPAATPSPQRRRPAAGVDPVPVEADDDIPATWDPRPVPTPTYAMKQRADHPVAAPAGVPVPEPIELEDDDEVSFGRVAGA